MRTHYLDRTGFTLLELIIVVIIVAVLIALGIPSFQGVVKKSRLAEIYPTISAIEKAEEMYYAQYGVYATEVSPWFLSFTVDQARIDNFTNVLGVGVPGLESEFVYGVYGSRIFVRIRDEYSEGNLCCKYLVDSDPYKKGDIRVYSVHPWAKYLTAVNN